jgi:hypothetical protein
MYDENLGECDVLIWMKLELLYGCDMEDLLELLCAVYFELLFGCDMEKLELMFILG